MVRPLRERIILPIAVAPGFLNWKTCKGWNPEAKASANASPERFRWLRCFQHQPSCGSRTWEGAAHKMPHHPKSDGKACSTAFAIAEQRSREGCRICAANSPLPSRERAGSRSEALSHRIRAQRNTCAQLGEAQCSLHGMPCYGHGPNGIAAAYA